MRNSFEQVDDFNCLYSLWLQAGTYHLIHYYFTSLNLLCFLAPFADIVEFSAFCPIEVILYIRER